VDGLTVDVFAGFDAGAGPFFFVFFFLSDLLFQPFDVFDAAAAVAPLDASLVYSTRTKSFDQ
jgi:hypothetical protein